MKNQAECEEKWRPAPGYGELYEVSDQGRVRSRRFGGKILKPRLTNGYARVELYNGRGARAFGIHQLVCAAFHGLQPEGHEVNHINCVRDDNRAENLEWVTVRQNALHRQAHGKSSVGSGNGCAKLDEKKVAKARRLYAGGGVSHAELAKRFGVSPSVMRFAVVGRTWKHVA